jgi:hypothetical protein
VDSRREIRSGCEPLPEPDQMEVAEAAAILGMPLHGDHPDQQHNLQDSALSKDWMVVSLDKAAPDLRVTQDVQSCGRSTFT